MIIEAGTLLCGYMLSKSELAQDIKKFGSKLNFFSKKKTNTYPDIINKYKNKEFMFWDVIELNVYNTILNIDTMKWIIKLWDKEFNLIQDDNSFIETVKFLKDDLQIEIKNPWEFWHTNTLNIPYWLLFHPEFLNKFREKLSNDSNEKKEIPQEINS